MVGFLVGLFVGCALGMLIVGLLTIKDDDIEQYENDCEEEMDDI